MSSNESVEVRVEEAECFRCKDEFERTVTYLDGSRLPGAPAVCGTCLDTEEEKSVVPIRTKVSREDRIMELLDEAGVNVRKHGRCTLNPGPRIGIDFDCGDSGARPLQATQEFVAEMLAAGQYGHVRSLYLCGTTGNGKTHLAAAACRKALLDERVPTDGVVFDSADRLIVEIQDTYGSGKTTAAMERRERARLWVLDDIGTEKATPDALRILLALINRREGHPTIFTSNHTPDELGQRWQGSGEVADGWARISSRLGAQNVRIVGLQGPDRRFANPTMGHGPR